MREKLRALRSSWPMWRPWMALTLSGVGLALLVAANRWWTVHYARPWVFALAWAGLRAWLFHGYSPYDAAALVEALRPWLGSPDPSNVMPTPLFAAWMYLPLALIPDGPTAYALWLTLQQGLVVAWTTLLARWMLHRDGLWFVFALLILAWPGTWMAWQEGYPTLFIMAALGIAWFHFLEGQDARSGLFFLPVLLDLAIFGWVLVAWGMWTLGRGRRDGPVTWGMVTLGGAVLMAWLRPRWWMDYLRFLGEQAPRLYSGPGLLARLLVDAFPGLGYRVGETAVALVLLWMLVQWGRAWVGSPWLAFWTWHWTLTLLPWLAWRFHPDLLVLLVPGILLPLSVWWDRWRFGRQAGMLVVLLLWGGLWLAYRSLTLDVFVARALLLLVPFVWLFLGWVRWWFLRPEPGWSPEGYRWG